MISWLKEHLIPCQFKSMTGYQCPGCGNQRAIIALLEGDIAASFVLFPALLFQVVTIFYLILHLIFKFSKGARNIKYLFAVTILVMLTNYIIKIINGQVF